MVMGLERLEKLLLEGIAGVVLGKLEGTGLLHAPM